MKTILAILTTCFLLIAQPVYSIDLQTAKDQGMVGETTSGYLEAVNTPSAEVKRLINDINIQRKEKYQEIAVRNNTTLQAVEELAGRKAIEKTSAGDYIKQNGTWLKK